MRGGRSWGCSTRRISPGTTWTRRRRATPRRAETGDRRRATGNRQRAMPDRAPRGHARPSLPVAGCLLPVSCLLFALHPHVPFVHASPAEHTFPQPPQFRGSVNTSTQTVPHWFVSPPHPHTPFWHE